MGSNSSIIKYYKNIPNYQRIVPVSYNEFDENEYDEYDYNITNKYKKINYKIPYLICKQ